jgi:hypothetical protein
VSRQCSAQSKQSGEQCKRPPIPGGNVCRMHGGAAPQVQASARDRLNALVEPAIEALGRAMRSRNVPAIVRAAQLVLDRCGFPPSRHHLVEADAISPLVISTLDHVKWLTDDQLTTMQTWMAEAKARAEAGIEPEPIASWGRDDDDDEPDEPALPSMQPDGDMEPPAVAADDEPEADDEMEL